MRKNLLRNRLIIIVLVIIGLLGIISVTLVKPTPLTIRKNTPVDRGHESDNDTSVTSEGLRVNLKFYSKSLKMDREVQIYLPPGYDQEGIMRYPVVYFLHGNAQNCYSEDQLFSILNNLINSKAISPVIMVKPDGSCPPWDVSYFINSELYGNFEDYLVNDLTEFIDSAYKTVASRDMRTIMGYSAGGISAMVTALKHPDIYCAVVSHSGRLNMWTHSLYIPFILSENGGSPVSSFHPNAGPMSGGIFTMAGALSPNLNNPPYFVDFPLDSMGNFIDSVWNRWLAHDCSALARKMSKKYNLAIYFDCGTYDETLAYDFNTSFADSLDKLAFHYEFQSYSGGHYDRYNRYTIGLAFLDSVMH